MAADHHHNQQRSRQRAFPEDPPPYTSPGRPPRAKNYVPPSVPDYVTPAPAVPHGTTATTDTSANKTPVTDPKDIVPLSRKLALALGAAPLIFPLVTSNVFINLFLLETAIISATNVSVVLFVGRAFDAISDPTVGFLVSKTQKKGSSLRTWMVGALPFLALAYFGLWQTISTSSFFKVFFYTSVYVILQVAFTSYSVPYSALIMYQTNDRRQRDITTAFRMTAEIMFAVLAVAVFAVIIGTSSGPDCSTEESIDESKEEASRLYFISATVIVGIICVAGVVTYFGTKERTDIRVAPRTSSIWKATKQVLTHRPYVLLMLSYFCMFLAVAIVQGNLETYFKYSVEKSNTDFAISMIILMATAGLGVPIWQVILAQTGKKKAAYIGIIIIVPSLSCLGFVPKDTPVGIIFLLCLVAGFGIGSGYFLPWSMLPDVVDDYTIKYNERSESVFYGFFVFFNKFAAGFGNGMSTLLLDVAGFKNDPCGKQPDAVDLTLRLLCAPGPATLVLLYGLFVYFYPLDEKACAQNKETLHARAEREKAVKQHEGYANPSYEYLPEYITYL